jgi:hypothetical protein
LTTVVTDQILVITDIRGNPRRRRFQIPGQFLTKRQEGHKFERPWMFYKPLEDFSCFRDLDPFTVSWLNKLTLLRAIVYFNLMPGYLEVEVNDEYEWERVEEVSFNLLTEVYNLHRPEVLFGD